LLNLLALGKPLELMRSNSIAHAVNRTNVGDARQQDDEARYRTEPTIFH
jgi:hypothetical protein